MYKMGKATEKDPIVRRRVGKKELRMRASHMLPFYYRQFSFYDRALQRICEKINDADGYLKFIDIGANIGDTVSLITDKVNGSFLCVEGDNEYLPLLKKNLSKIKDSKIFIEESYCSDGDRDSNLMVERIDGTAKITSGKENDEMLKEKFTTLDDIIKKRPLFNKANVLKIDTDGFEISILKGGKKFIRAAKPVLFFEFTPELYIKNNQDPLFVFDFLNRNDYPIALIYDNFGRPLEIVNTADKKRIKELMELIDNNKIYYYDVLAYHHSKENKYGKLFERELLACFSLAKNEFESAKKKLDSIRRFLDSIKTKFDLTKAKLGSMESCMKSVKSKVYLLKKELNTSKTELEATKEELIQTQMELGKTKKNLFSAGKEIEKIHNSREWKTALAMRRMVKRAIPIDSFRRKALVGSWGAVKRSLRLARDIKHKLPKPKQRRKINLQSKKIVYVGHSYHDKTKSTAFLIDYLKKFYDVKVILDDSWQGKPFSDLSFVDESYLGVIFFQALPDKETLGKIKNENLIFFPMYDGVPHTYEFWNNYRNLKVINFSRTLHEKLVKWGLDSIYLQYFPEVREFLPGNKNEVFFWQRLTRINIRTILKLFGKRDLKIHIHKAVDPGQEFIEPSKKDEKKFSITYSDWFKTREEMWDLIKQKGIYIAPREFEGIGMSFLEAMAMGKAVIAVDNPTMNEYIENGKNGYLYDLSNPQKIDLSNIGQIQKNAYEFMHAGYKKWMKDKHKIVEFLNKY